MTADPQNAHSGVQHASRASPPPSHGLRRASSPAGGSVAALAAHVPLSISILKRNQQGSWRANEKTPQRERKDARP